MGCTSVVNHKIRNDDHGGEGCSVARGIKYRIQVRSLVMGNIRHVQANPKYTHTKTARVNHLTHIFGDRLGDPVCITLYAIMHLVFLDKFGANS